MTPDLRVDRVDRTTIEVPFRETPAPHLYRTVPDWRFFEICEIELACGAVGHGETMLFYPRAGRVEDATRIEGDPAMAHAWDDTLGDGIQVALFDAVGRALDVPIHCLLGDAVRESIPVSWWCIDMSPEDWVAEAREARERGYESLKVKARPWWPLREGIAALSHALPEEFRIGLDFNTTMVDAERAVPVLEDLAAYPQVSVFEEPIPREDFAGYRRIREAIDVSIAHHFTYDDPIEGLAADVADCYVRTDGATEMRNRAATLAIADEPLWYQLVGTGLTAAWGLHVGAVLEAATLPGVNCHEVFAESLVKEDITVSDGHVPVPDGPGLGYEVDTDAVERLAVDMDAADPDPERLIAVEYPDDRTYYFATGRQLRTYAQAGSLPYFEREVETRTVPNDGSDWWTETRSRAADEPVVER